jgi:CHAT domain-containing protein
MVTACSSADSDDGELATALATGFLASGSKQVIGTLRPINDAGAWELANKFYLLNGVSDPARVLARVQAELDGTSNADWPNFVLFGHDNCRRD